MESKTVDTDSSSSRKDFCHIACGSKHTLILAANGDVYGAGDNKSVATNASIPTSVLNKRHNAICYHRVREAQAAGTIMVGWISGEYNLADLFTKTTMTGELKHRLVHNIFNNEAAPIEVKT